MTGAQTYWVYDDTDDTVTLRTVQDVEPIIEMNKALYAQTDEKARWGEWNHVAQIPLHILDKWIEEGIMERDGRGWTFKDNKEALKRLDDPDFRYFRTRPGKLSR